MLEWCLEVKPCQPRQMWVHARRGLKPDVFFGVPASTPKREGPGSRAGAVSASCVKGRLVSGKLLAWWFALQPSVTPLISLCHLIPEVIDFHTGYQRCQFWSGHIVMADDTQATGCFPHALRHPQTFHSSCTLWIRARQCM